MHIEGFYDFLNAIFTHSHKHMENVRVEYKIMKEIFHFVLKSKQPEYFFMMMSFHQISVSKVFMRTRALCLALSHGNVTLLGDGM